MTTRKLHIVIPTFRRASQLVRTLEALAPQVSRCHLTVLNNDSPDDTAKVADEFAARFPAFVTVIHRPTNIGGMANILGAYLIGLERGEYVWVIGDDDIIDTHALGLFLDSLDNEKEAGAFVVSECEYATESKSWPPAWANVRDGKFWWHASFLPTLVFRRDVLIRGFAYSQRFSGGSAGFGGCYSHMLLMGVLTEPDIRLRIAPDRVLARGDYDNGALTSAAWLIDWLRICRTLEPGVRPGLIRLLASSRRDLPVRFAKLKWESRLKKGNAIYPASFFYYLSVVDLAWVPYDCMAFSFTTIRLRFKATRRKVKDVFKRRKRQVS